MYLIILSDRLFTLKFHSDMGLLYPLSKFQPITMTLLSTYHSWYNKRNVKHPGDSAMEAHKTGWSHYL